MTSTESTPTLRGFQRADKAAEHITDTPLLLVGNAGIGKRRWCQQTAAQYDVSHCYDPISVVGVQQMKEVTLHQPNVAFAVGLNNAHHKAQSAMLGFLESSPAKIFLHVDTDHVGTVSDALISRCQCIVVPRLRSSVVYDICREHGMDDAEATLSARYGDGVPAKALTAMDTLRARGAVREAMRAVREDDFKSLKAAIDRSSEDDLNILISHAVMTLSERDPVLWLAEDMEPLTRCDGALQMLVSMRRQPWDGQSRLRTALWSVYLVILHHYHGRL